MKLPEIWGSFRRRKLATWTLAYVTGAAALFGTLESVGDVFDWSSGILRASFFLLLTGLFATMIVAWFHGERGRQRVGPLEAFLLGAAGVLGVTAALASLAASGSSVDAEPGLSLAVRDFRDASPHGDQAYLSRGVSEELRRVLSGRTRLPVIRNPDAAEGGAYILDGSVMRSSDQITLTARLVGPDGGDVWSDEIIVPVSGLIDAQLHVASQVAERVGSGEQQLASGRVRPVRDPEAHEAFLRGEEALRLRTPASVMQAIAQYRRAAELDPDLAAALAREAYAYGLFLDWGWTYPGIGPDDLLRRGRELSRHAVAIDSLSPESWLAHAYLGFLADPGHPEVAIPAFSRAVQLDPTNPEAQHQFGQTLMIAGRYAEARGAYHAALALDGARPLTVVALSAIARRVGDNELALRWADSAVALGEGAPYAWASRGLMHLGLEEPQRAVEDAEAALRIDPSYEVPARSILAGALWRTGARDRAVAELARARGAMVDPEEPDPTSAYFLGAALIYMDRPGEALDLIEAARPRSRLLWFLLQSPTFDALRDDERFARIEEAASGG